MKSPFFVVNSRPYCHCRSFIEKSCLLSRIYFMRCRYLWAMSLVGIYPGRASLTPWPFLWCFILLQKLPPHSMLLVLSIQPGGGGGGYSQKNWIGVCGPLPKSLTLFMTKINNPVSELPYNYAGCPEGAYRV